MHKKNKICDFGKITISNIDYNGESVGFFKFDYMSSIKLLHHAKKIMDLDNNEVYEEVIRKIIKNKIFKIGFENIRNLSWTEIDFKKDLIIAKKKIIKQINE